MARTTTVVKILESRRKYIWPEAQLNFWLFIMLIAGSLILGVFAYFMVIQNQIRAGQIWLFPFSISVGILTLIFLGIILFLVAQRQLLPGIMMLGCFILFVLYLAGLIETSIQLYGPRGSVNSFCNAYKPVKGFEQGQGESTLAYLMTKQICDDWKAAFAFYMVGCVFLLWMMVMGYQVQRGVFD